VLTTTSDDAENNTAVASAAVNMYGSALTENDERNADKADEAGAG